jgi:hypothetical protein
MEGFVLLILVVAVFAAFALAALGFGTDSRDARWGIVA